MVSVRATKRQRRRGGGGEAAARRRGRLAVWCRSERCLPVPYNAQVLTRPPLAGRSGPGGSGGGDGEGRGEGEEPLSAGEAASTQGGERGKWGNTG